MAFRPFSRQLNRIEQGVAAGLYRTGVRILNRSQELVPVDTGTLKGSGRVLQPEVEGDRVTVTVGYGYGPQMNPATGESPSGYALIVHEIHPTKSKYLEQAAGEELREIAPTVAASITRARKLPGGGVEFFEETLDTE